MQIRVQMIQKQIRIIQFIDLLNQMDFEHILDDLYLQLNECRLHPRETANKLSQLKNAYQGNVFRNQYKTREGPQALENLIQDFMQRSPMGKRLKWSFALHMAADEQASILGQRGIYTTEGTSYHKTLPERVKDFAIVKGRLSEVYEFGGRTPNEILEELLIDDGLASRKRRNTLMDPIYNYIGIASSYHESNQACTVIILAQDIVSLVAPDANGKYKRRRLEQGRENAIKLTEQVVIGNIMGSLIPGAIGLPQPNQSSSSASNTLNTIVPNALNQSNVNNTTPINNINRNTTNQPQFVLDPSRNTNLSNVQGNSGSGIGGGETVTYTNNTNTNSNLNTNRNTSSNIGGNQIAGETVTYLNNSNINNTGINNSTIIPPRGQTVTYNTNPTQQNYNSVINPTIPAGGSTVSYQGNSMNQPTTLNVGPAPNLNPSPSSVSLTPSQFQEKQYEFYKQQEPTITINNNPVPNNNVNPSINTNGNLSVPAPVAPKPEQKSRCSIM